MWAATAQSCLPRSNARRQRAASATSSSHLRLGDQSVDVACELIEVTPVEEFGGGRGQPGRRQARRDVWPGGAGHG